MINRCRLNTPGVSAFPCNVAGIKYPYNRIMRHSYTESQTFFPNCMTKEFFVYGNYPHNPVCIVIIFSSNKFIVRIMFLRNMTKKVICNMRCSVSTWTLLKIKNEIDKKDLWNLLFSKALMHQNNIVVCKPVDEYHCCVKQWQYPYKDECNRNAWK